MRKFLILILLFFFINLVYSAGADIVIDSSTSWTPGTYDYGTVTVNNSAVLTLQGNTTSGTGVIINADNIIVEAGSSISANGQGYQPPSTGSTSGNGPGGGLAVSTRSCGAGYGGAGGKSSSGGATNAVSYGDMSQPLDLGSSGGCTYTVCGGAGGGAIKLNVSNTLTVNGIVSANGFPGGAGGGGGSGGSILLFASTILGSGSITVNGGNGNPTVSPGGGGGAGGRIAVFYDSNTFSGPITAYGGVGVEYGGGGTIYTKSSSQSNFNLVVDNNNHNNGAYTYFSDPAKNWVADNITLEVYSKVSNLDNLKVSSLKIIQDGSLVSSDSLSIDNFDIGSNSLVTATNDVEINSSLISSGTITSTNGDITINDDINGLSGPGYSLSNGGLYASSGLINLPSIQPYSYLTLNNFDLTMNDSLIITNNFIISGSLSCLNLSVGDTITILSGGTLTHDDESHNGLQINTNTLNINSGGSINVNGKGYRPPLTSDTNGNGDGFGYTSSTRSGGAGYGGYGGKSISGASIRGAIYGTNYTPNLLGSSGGCEYLPCGGAGAGFVKINVSSVTVNGIISANGNNGNSAGGGGSGGSIWLITNSLSGSGSITANGGNGNPSTGTAAGGGGGGRIALYCSDNFFGISNFFVNGGAGYENGGIGSKYIDSSCIEASPSLASYEEPPTPKHNSKILEMSSFEVKLGGLGLSLDSCNVNINGTIYPMSILGSSCSYVYNVNSSNSVQTFTFNASYVYNSTNYNLEERTIYVYPSKGNNQKFPSVGVGSLIFSVMIFILVLFL